MADAARSESETTLTITRIFNAPRERVFDAWLDPKQVGQWMGPTGVEAKAEQLDARVGGRYRIVMITPQGTPTVGGVYQEIARPERLVFTWGWEEAHNAPAGHESVVTLSFRDLNGKTEMTILHERFATQEARDSHQHGWTGSFDKLAGVLGG